MTRVTISSAFLPLGDRAGDAELDLESDHLLLGPVVQVALEAVAFGVSRGDQPTPRRPNVRGALFELAVQADVAQEETGRGCDVGQQLAVGGRHRVVAGLDDGERPERHAVMEDRPGLGDVVIGQTVDRDGLDDGLSRFGKHATRPEHPAGGDPHDGALGSGAPHEQLCEIAGAVARSDVGEAGGHLGQHLVRTHPVAVHQTVGRPLEA